MLGFADAFMGARRLRLTEDEAAAARAERDQRMAWEREDRARKQSQLTAEDDAWRTLGDLEKNGVADGSKLGLSAPSTQMLVAGNAGYGTGDAAAQEAAGDYQREMGRYAAAGMPAQGGPKFDATAAVQRTAAKESDIYGGMMGVARARKDMGAYATTRGLQKGAKEDELIAGVKLPDAGTPEFAAMTEQLAAYVNTNHQSLTLGEPDAKGFREVSIVKPDGKSVFTKLSRAEQLKMMQANALLETNPTRAMKMFEDINKDIAAVVARDSDLVGKAGEAGNTTAYRREGLRLDEARTAEQVRNNKAREGIARAEVGGQNAARDAANWQIIGTTADKKGLLYFNRATRQTEARPLPAGSDAEGLFRRLSGERPTAMTPAERAKIMIDAHAAGMSPMQIATMLEGFDPNAAFKAALVGGAPSTTGAATAQTDPGPGPQQGRGLFTDRQGNTQLLEPFTRLNEYRRGLQQQSLGY